MSACERIYTGCDVEPARGSPCEFHGLPAGTCPVCSDTPVGLRGIIERYLLDHGFTLTDGYWGHPGLGQGRRMVQAIVWQIGREQYVWPAETIAAAAERDPAREALSWFDFIEDVEQTDCGSELVTVTITRTSEGWRKAQEAYRAAFRNPDLDDKEAER